MAYKPYYWKGKSQVRKKQIIDFFFESWSKNDNVLLDIKQDYINGDFDLAEDKFNDVLSSMDNGLFNDYIIREGSTFSFMKAIIPELESVDTEITIVTRETTFTSRIYIHPKYGYSFKVFRDKKTGQFITKPRGY